MKSITRASISADALVKDEVGKCSPRTAAPSEPRAAIWSAQSRCLRAFEPRLRSADVASARGSADPFLGIGFGDRFEVSQGDSGLLREGAV